MTYGQKPEIKRKRPPIEAASDSLLGLAARLRLAPMLPLDACFQEYRLFGLTLLGQGQEDTQSTTLDHEPSPAKCASLSGRNCQRNKQCQWHIASESLALLQFHHRWPSADRWSPTFAFRFKVSVPEGWWLKGATFNFKRDQRGWKGPVVQIQPPLISNPANDLGTGQHPCLARTKAGTSGRFIAHELRSGTGNVDGSRAFMVSTRGLANPRACRGRVDIGAMLSNSIQTPRGRGNTLRLSEDAMDTTTLLIIVIIVLLLGGGGWYGRGRWF
jgi:hypothetical protein